MSKELTPLQALKRIKEHHEIKGIDYNDNVSVVGYINEQELDIIETALKQYEAMLEALPLNCKNNRALEIIKEKEMLSVFKDINGKCFIFFNTTGVKISQEEFDLLKEIVK